MKKEDYEVWSLKREFTFEEAGWLWFERQPYDYKETPPQTLRNITTMIDILKEAADEGKFLREATNSGVGGIKRYVQEGISSNKVSRSSLRAYAESIGQKPLFLFSDGRNKCSVLLPEEKGKQSDTKQEEVEPTDDKSIFTHSPDYSSVKWKEISFKFTSRQAQVVEILHKQGCPEVGKEYILEALGSPSSRLRDTFKKSPAWGTLIIPGAKRGTYRLNI